MDDRRSCDPVAMSAAARCLVSRRIGSGGPRPFNSAEQLDQARAVARSTEGEYGAGLKATDAAQAQFGEAQARQKRAQTAPQQVALEEAALSHASSRSTTGSMGGRARPTLAWSQERYVARAARGRWSWFAFGVTIGDQQDRPGAIR